jgi:hypothetical protein
MLLVSDLQSEAQRTVRKPKANLQVSEYESLLFSTGRQVMAKQEYDGHPVIYSFKKPEEKRVSSLKDLFVWEFGHSHIIVKEDEHKTNRLHETFTTTIDKGFYKGKTFSFYVTERKYTDSRGSCYNVVLKRQK